jgi:hypothetical protein
MSNHGALDEQIQEMSKRCRSSRGVGVAGARKPPRKPPREPLPTAIVHHVASFLNIADGDWARWSCVNRDMHMDLKTCPITHVYIAQHNHQTPPLEAMEKWGERLQRVDIQSEVRQRWPLVHYAKRLASFRLLCTSASHVALLASFLELGKPPGLVELMVKAWWVDYLYPANLALHWSTLRRLQCPLASWPTTVAAPCLEELDLTIHAQRDMEGVMANLAKQPRLRHLELSLAVRRRHHSQCKSLR